MLCMIIYANYGNGMHMVQYHKSHLGTVDIAKEIFCLSKNSTHYSDMC